MPSGSPARAVDPHPVVQVAPVGSAHQSGEYGQLLSEALERAAAAMVVAAAVDHDAAQPGREFGLAAKAADLFDEQAADVLGDILRVRPGSGHLPGERVDSVVMPA
jgi:hypothetical protein